MTKITKISELKPSDEIFVFDKLHSEKSPTLYTVSDFIEAYKERPEDFGKACSSGFFLELVRFEVDYSELTPQKPEAEPDPAPGRTKIELKPCPFCGGSSDFSEIVGMFIVRCCECGISTQLRDTLEEAAAEWNRRVNSTKELIK